MRLELILNMLLVVYNYYVRLIRVNMISEWHGVFIGRHSTT